MKISFPKNHTANLNQTWQKTSWDKGKFSNEFAVDTIINVLLFYFVIKGVGIIIILFKPVFFLP